VLFEPRLGLRLRYDREDFDGLVLDVIEHSYLAYMEAKLRFAYTPKPLDPALASLLGVVTQVRLECVHASSLCGQGWHGHRRPFHGLGRGHDVEQSFKFQAPMSVLSLMHQEAGTGRRKEL